MSGKNQGTITFNWQSTNPQTGFLPTHPRGGSVPSGVSNGVMNGTNTIYSQIVNVSTMDNLGLEVNFSGTPTGTFSVFGSVSGANFYPLTFNPVLTQPAGSAGGYLVNISVYSFTYFALQYLNNTGTGILTVYGQQKDVN